MNSVGSKILSLKYQRFAPSGCKDRDLKFEFVAKTQFIIRLHLKNNKHQLKGQPLPVEGKKIDFFNLCHPQSTHECPQKISAHSVRPFCRLQGTYIRMSCFIIQIKITISGLLLKTFNLLQFDVHLKVGPVFPNLLYIYHYSQSEFGNFFLFLEPIFFFKNNIIFLPNSLKFIQKNQFVSYDRSG